MNTFVFQYKLKRQTVEIPPWSFDLQVLVDFDQTVDDMFIQPDVPQDLDLCPYFGTLWPSALSLARNVAGEADDQMRGCSLLEVGCGLGVPAMVALKQGAQVTAMDYHPDVEAFLRENLRVNGLPDDSLTFVRGSWLNPSPSLKRYDWIIGSDVLYSAEQPIPLAAFIHQHLSPQGKVIITDPGRAYLQDFVSAMEKHGFASNVQIMPVTWQDKTIETFVLRFWRTTAS